MKESILLVEPAYRTKYPPLGLMKLSTYHKNKGDNVVFVKGCVKKSGNIYLGDVFWNRVYITTLFTWTWDATIKTIKFYNNLLAGFTKQMFVGGILASLKPKELYNATGVQPIIGLLENSSQIKYDDNVNIDMLAPDYDIVKQVESDIFSYSNTDKYLGYATRGCIRNCEYCAVKILEPKFNPHINVKKLVQDIVKDHGEKKDLLLMDNNILASPDFDQIIDEIKEVGFVKGAKYGRTKKKRTVDFNQGLDARLLDEHKMNRLSEIPLEPMRLAFDSIKYKKVYVKAVKLAHKYGQKNMSNYVLYNYKDTPEDFYERLKINIELNEKFIKANKKDREKAKTTIYSFPMRFIPLGATDRNVNTGNKSWNKRYLRSVKLILNVTKGPVMPGAEFFYQAFGRNEEEFKAILLMPDAFIRHRVKPDWKQIINAYEERLMPDVRTWFESYKDLKKEEKCELISILAPNDADLVRESFNKVVNKKIKTLVKMYLDAEGTVVKRKKKGYK